MKKIKAVFVFLMFLFSVVSSIAQSPSGYHYNQAKAFNQYIGDGTGEWRFLATDRLD